MEKERFEKEFVSEERELLVLVQKDVGGARIMGEYYQPSVTFLAAVDVKTGEFCDEKGRLEWIYKKGLFKKGWGFDLKGMTIYQVRVRRCIEKELAPNMLKEMNNRYMLLEVVKKNVHHDKLEKIREAYMKPVAIDNEIGHFELNRDYGWFEGKINWLGEECRVMLDTDCDGGDTADKAMEGLRSLAADLSGWDKKVREFAAAELTELANEWQESDEEDEEPHEITQEEFARRIEISEIIIDAEGDMEITFYDDDMFWGHYVVVYGNVSGELERAQMEG